MPTKLKVLLAVPTAGSIDHRLVPHIVTMCKDRRYDVELFISWMIGNEANRNAITKHFLKGTWDYLLMIDTDQEPLENPLDMLQHDKDVMSMPTIINMNGLMWNIYDRCDDLDSTVEARTERYEGIERVYATGTGCVLIKRKVLETLKHPFSPHRDDNDHRLVTQDIVFSMRCAEAGFEIWAEWDRVMRHFKEVDLLSL